MSDRARRPGLSVRMQLTLSYAALLVLAGLALFAVGILIVRFIPEGNLTAADGGFAPGRDDLIDVFVRYSVVALLGLAAVGLGGGWILAGRMLKPLTRITEAARRARDGSLSQRIRMPGRQNELAELADTFDDMLNRVQLSIEEQRRFAANASHELRTPLAVMRTMLEVARADPKGRDIDALLGRLEQTNERSIALIEALLALSDIEHRERDLAAVDLSALVGQVLDEVEDAAAQLDLRIESDLQAGAVSADAALLRQLVANLVQNAIVHNHAGGVVWLTISREADGTTLEVANTGEVLDQDVVDTLTEPFVRGAGRARRRTDRHVGAGLGLAIANSIADAHGARMALRARAKGGLAVSVHFADGGRPGVSSGP
jgi:two-component system sensor histidine kinase VanS